MANPGLSSPPPDCSQDTTALPSLPLLLSPEDMACTNAMPVTHGDVDDDGFHPVRASREWGQMLSMGHTSWLPMLALPATQTSPSREINSFALLRSDSSVATASPVPQTTTTAPPATASLLAMVDADFIEVFGNDEERDMDDPQFCLRKIFREGAHQVDNMIDELRDENTRTMNRIETKLDLVLTALRTPRDETDERLVALEHEIRDLKDIWLVLDDLHYRQLTKIRGDIGKVEEGIARLDPKFSHGLDEVNLRVDDILTRLASPPARNDPSIGRSTPLAKGDDDQHHLRDTPLMAQTNIDTAPSTPIPPTWLAGRSDGSYGSDVNPTTGRMRYNPPNG
jgi:hypothetical protein